jgi:PAS domain S-box-containing protein
MKNRSEFSENLILCDQWLRLLDQLNIGAFTVGLNRKISGINQTCVNLMELDGFDVVGLDCIEVFCGVPCLMRCLIDGGETLKENLPQLPQLDIPPEEPHLIRLSTPMLNPRGDMVGCLTILQDYSPFAELINRVHFEERSLKIILDNLDVCIFTINRGGYITFFNTAAERISGYSRQEVLGTPCETIFGKDAENDLQFLMATIKDGKPRLGNGGRLTTRDGESVPFKARYMPLENEQGKIVGGLATLQDLILADQLDRVMSDRYSFHHMIGKNPTMQKIFEMVGVVAKTDATVLIEGSTGTGKDLLAKVIHSASKRSRKPFVKVNCAALPDNLLESEMFGYAKGAFTGADRDKPGRFNEADEGTFFLDEIGDLPLSLQAKLLRVLEDKEFYPLGSRHTMKVNVRIISATNRGLENLVAARQFREDLFYRLNVMRIELPPLKERRSDIPLLIRHIVRKLCATRTNRLHDISEGAMNILLNYDYPGNVRELENILEHALILCRDQMIQPEHLPDYVLKGKTIFDINESPARMDKIQQNAERLKIEKRLLEHNGNRGKTASSLGINRTTLWRKMKRLGLL